MHYDADMARKFFGFGRWNAPYWFIGPEPGKGPKESPDDTERINAWVRLGKRDLVDCKEFHYELGDDSWHRESPKPRLQSTWRPLMLLLRVYLNEAASLDDLRTYQSDRWGRIIGGETCVIELCGLAASGFSTAMDRESFREERVEIICQKIREHRPRVVVMYGQNEQRRWEEIAGCTVEIERPHKTNSTVFVFTPHPNKRGRRNSDWESVGKKLRDHNHQ